MFLDILGDSILGLADVYNLLPECIVQEPTVKNFQSALQDLVKDAAIAKTTSWELMFSPRLPLHSHMLKKWFQWHRGSTKIIEPIGLARDVQVINCANGWLNFGAANHNDIG